MPPKKAAPAKKKSSSSKDTYVTKSGVVIHDPKPFVMDVRKRGDSGETMKRYLLKGKTAEGKVKPSFVSEEVARKYGTPKHQETKPAAARKPRKPAAERHAACVAKCDEKLKKAKPSKAGKSNIDAKTWAAAVKMAEAEIERSQASKAPVKKATKALKKAADAAGDAEEALDKAAKTLAAGVKKAPKRKAAAKKPATKKAAAKKPAAKKSPAQKAAAKKRAAAKRAKAK